MNKLFLLGLPIFYIGCFSPQIYTTSGKIVEKQSITTIINDSGLNTNIGIKAVSLKSGKTIYELNSKSLFNPASNNKLYSAIAALSILDTGFTFKTSVYGDNDKIFLVGGGDPDLKVKTLDSLSEIVSKKFPLAKRVYLDDTITDSLVYGPGWMWDEGDEWYSAEVSGLSVNDNCIDFVIGPSSPGSLISVETYPKSNYYKINNSAITVSDTSEYDKIKIVRDWKNKKNIFQISGTILDTSSTDTLIRNISNPTMFAGNLFYQMLIDKGLQISKLKKGIYKGSGLLIATHRSKSLLSSLENLMVESDNLTAELLVKMIGYESVKNQGNWQNGLFAIKNFINDDIGIDTSTFSLSDGSGVSRYNYSSPSHFTDLLVWAYNNPKIKDNFLEILSTTSNKETLKDRNLPEGVYAKTGSLSGVTTFSGYILNSKSEPIAFSILINGFKGSSAPYRKLQDTIVSRLSH
jgi:D-alanyl-D-alanine carboxypeptidase/D-alanyl-D-alanine-endopeptidase (penicillin-binding protein 4)